MILGIWINTFLQNVTDFIIHLDSHRFGLNAETYTTNAQRDIEQNKKRKKIKSIMISKENILP